ncbi:GMC oxidoreductase [Wolfiporia cocos MD-104 SS10]|uniref:GMC oxidoreductase n=1 Tax=Wolfiporia cocos (strain MD-104) TaxID=742152 RepID=A0A2H3K3V1_WOLCO|nr:GMC oxidoreductase [Wolfiporia cocos MD-104 SS10]
MVSNAVEKEFDIIIAGGGTCGCVIASRLSVADPTLRILLLEAGPPTHDNLAHIQPARYLSHLLPQSSTMRFVVGKESEDIGGACASHYARTMSRGRFQRQLPCCSDYDDWEKVYGNAGWGYSSLLPFLRKFETYQAAPSLETHGYDGPLKVSFSRTPNPLAEEFLDIAARYDPIRDVTQDPNDMFHCNAYALKHEDVHADIQHNRGTRAAGSPAILQRSGIGASTLLQRLDIPTIVNLPGVGENYQGPRIQSWPDADHQGLFSPYIIDDNADTIDGILQNDPNEIAKWTAQWLNNGSGLMASKPSEEELKSIGPEFEQRWNDHFAGAPDKPVLWLGPITICCNMAFYIEYPQSIGSVHITSAADIQAPQNFDPQFLKHKGDVALLRWAYKRGRELARRMPSYRGEFLPEHPQFFEGSQAVCHAEASPVNVSAPDIEYTPEDDRAIDASNRQNLTTVWHSNTYSTALVIGEKAASMVMEELGICQNF